MTKHKISKFQLEAPSTNDSFEGAGHESAADGIKHIIKNFEEIDLIGLEGCFGSGKSTIIKILEKKLEDEQENYHFIYFDIDQHHHSSTKAAFIENFANEISLISPKNQKNINDIKNRALGNTLQYDKNISSSISFLAVAYIISYILTVKNIDKSFTYLFEWLFCFRDQCSSSDFDIHKFITVISTTSPLLIWLFASLFTEGKNISPADVLKKNTKDTINETFSVTREVGSIELKKAFNSFIDLVPNNEKIILIIDNIDRVEKGKVQEIWSDIDIFASTGSKNLKIILPYSEYHVAKAMNPDNINEGKEYISKRLPIVFRSPPIVSAGWANQFQKYWEETIENLTESNACVKLIEIWKDPTKDVTPRFLKRHINDIACIITCHSQEISPICCSAYLLSIKGTSEPNISLEDLLSITENKEETDDRTLIKLTQNILNESMNKEQWTTQIACIHYQTNENIAKSELIYFPMNKAISSLDISRIFSLSSIYGFDFFFSKAISETSPLKITELLSKKGSLSDEEYKIFVEKWLPITNIKINDISSLEYNEDYMEAVQILKERDFDPNLNIAQIIFNKIDNDSKEDKIKKDTYNDKIIELHMCSKLLKKSPFILREPNANVFSRHLWPLKEKLEEWHIKGINFAPDDKLDLLKAACEEYETGRKNNDFFLWFMESYRLGEIVTPDDTAVFFPNTPSETLITFSPYIIPFEHNWENKINANELLNKILSINNDENSDWICLEILRRTIKNNLNEMFSINNRYDSAAAHIAEMIKENPTILDKLWKYLVLSNNFDLITNNLEHDFIKNSVKNIIKHKKVHRLNIENVIKKEKYEILSEIFNDDPSPLINFVFGWEQHIPNLFDQEDNFLIISDILNSNNEQAKNKITSDLTQKIRDTDWCKDFILRPSDNTKKAIETIRKKQKHIEKSTKIVDIMSNIIKEMSEEDAKSYDNLDWHETIFSVLLDEDKVSIKNRLERALRLNDISNNKKQSIIRNNHTIIRLPSISEELTIENYITLLEDTTDKVILKWYDEQEWDIKKWPRKKVNELQDAVNRKDEIFPLDKLKNKLSIDKDTKQKFK
ncbi:P-loop NTPase fold protein [Zymobacter sp. IVIA_12111.31 C1]|uniref:P-loop NTPase fold protein n=1 Tax=Zymobacter sp. IVIA_12111.31 C1 TaxID=3394854 RepID=UPI0039C0D971